ncbi:hypothetical protein GOP47_0019923 [Adiantum capillus-veneris]|uniref:NPH3 domain-containing protein n=1 Tax=Adiantum capillus-veneris TaxID=13818 RepID=A0A9D4Z7I0_ADICA|nr:hypothetical protein GOP47_0019923 [Adiantum capillus-veneris]
MKPEKRLTTRTEHARSLEPAYGTPLWTNGTFEELPGEQGKLVATPPREAPGESRPANLFDIKLEKSWRWSRYILWTSTLDKTFAQSVSCKVLELFQAQASVAMKFMKIGSRPDTFQALGTVRSVHSEISSDLTVVLNGVSFRLHKFPLLSKCMKLKKYAAEVHDLSSVELQGVPGGVETFELCAKFCYGITITLNAYNVVAVRCAAEHLEMTEAADKGNLIFKVEVFLNACIFRGWRDAIIALQSTKGLLPWAEDLEVTSKCVDAISSKVLVDPVRVDWTFSYTRATSKSRSKSEIVESSPWNGIHTGQNQSVPADWWIEDIAELEIDLFWRVFIAIKSQDRLPNTLLGEALQFYTIKWLPGVSKEHHLTDPKKRSDQALRTDYVDSAVRHRQLLEKVVSLLPPGKGCTSCSFLLKLLKAGMILGASNTTRMELAKRAGLQLEEASVSDLLIPSLSYASDALYDVDLVQTLVEHFLTQDQSPRISPKPSPQPYEKRRTRSAEFIDYVESRRSAATHSSKLRAAKVIDAYLAEIARDDHLGVSKFMTLAGLIPDFARPVHDGLYRAIDIYLKEHPRLTKMERKRLCRLLNCKKLSTEACVHAAQNERLPLRVVVQVLFYEQRKVVRGADLSLIGGKLWSKALNQSRGTWQL